MVRTIGVLLILAILYLYSIDKEQPKVVQKMPGQSIITVEELPPIRAEKE